MLNNSGGFMNKITFGLLCGFVFGAFSVIIMLPMKFDSKREKYESLIGSFLERFMLGFIIPNDIGLSPILTGAIFGFGLSLPTSIITRAYIPINLIGIAGGLLIGFLSGVLL